MIDALTNEAIDARIRACRTAAVTVTVRDAAGAPVADAVGFLSQPAAAEWGGAWARNKGRD